MKKNVFYFFALLLLFSCKKTDDSQNEKDFWKNRRSEISANVQAQFISIKRALPSSVTPANGSLTFDDSQITKILNLPNSEKPLTTIKKPANSQELIAVIKGNQLMSGTPVGPGDPTEPTGDPVMVLLADGYRAQYWAATNNYTDLDAYKTELDGIALGLLYDLYNTEEEKTQILTEIEWLKVYATSFEQDIDFWIDLTETAPLVSVSVSIKNSSLMSLKQIDKFMGYNKANCKVNTKEALKQGVMTGLFRGGQYAIVGGISGTVTVPVIGTVTGAVSGFMSGFAYGFVQGTLSSVAGQLLSSCFK